MTSLHLMRPELLSLLLPALALFFLLWLQRKRRGSWNAIIDPQLLQHLMGENAQARSSNLLPLLLVGWIVAVIAATGPSWKKIPQPVHQKQDAMVLLLDLSYSMKSEDVAPSRLDRSRQKLMDLLALRREGQTGLVAFAGDAHIVTPLTDDVPTIANLLPALHPDMMPVPGSDSASAVRMGLELLHSAGIRNGKMLLLTDGVSEKAGKEIAKTLSGSGVHLSVMSVGTATGAPIPLARGGFLKDQDGAIVMPGVDSSSLRELAEAAGGSYVPMQVDGSDLTKVLAETNLLPAQQTLALGRSADTWEDQGYWLILLLLPLTLGLFRRGWVVGLLPILMLSQSPESQAQTWNNLWQTPDQQGQDALQQGQPGVAAELFENHEWAGTAAYREGKFEQAAEQFSKTETANSWYNRGNALAKAGKLDEALEAYEQSLQLQPDQNDALQNKELIEQLKEQQEQEQQHNQGQSDPNQDGDSEEQDQQEGQDSQSQQGQDDSENQSDQNSNDSQQQPEGPSQSNEESGDPSEQDGTSAENGADEERDQQKGQEQQSAENGSGDDPEEREGQAAAMSPEEEEQNQAMQQWLRRVPDDPSGLLREKFRYESELRKAQGDRSNDGNYW